jgi:outer membrane protein TolC
VQTLGVIVAAVALMAAIAPTCLRAQISLGTAVYLAQRNSSAVKLADADVMKAAAALSQTKDVYIPSVNFSSGLPFVPSVGFLGGLPSIFSASMQSLVFSLPQKQYIDSARAGLKAATLNLKDAREQAALDASTAYIELDTVNSELAAARDQEGFAVRAVAIEQERAEAGVDPLSELLQVRLTAAELKLKRIHLEGRMSVAVRQISVLTGLPESSMLPDHASIPEIPQVHGDVPQGALAGIEAARMLALSKQRVAKGDSMYTFLPQVSLNAQYSRYTTILNNADQYYKHPLKSDNFGSGFNIQVPLFDMGHRAKVRESAADALRATVEAEQAQRQNDVQIALLTGNIRELDALAEISSLKQQIAGEQLKAVETQLELGNGAGVEPGATPQLSPKAEQLARIDERQKTIDALDAGFDLSKARLGLLRALGHMDEWLRELPPDTPADKVPNQRRAVPVN